MSERIDFDRMRQLISEEAALKPLLDEALRTSTPDPEHVWSGAGELATVGHRLVSPDRLEESARSVGEAVGAHLAELYSLVAKGISYVSRGLGEEAARSFLDAAGLEEKRGHPERAANLAATAYRVLSPSAGAATSSLVLRRWARAERGRGALESASELYARAADVSRGTGDVPGLAEALIGAGNVAEQAGHWSAAERRYREAIDLLDDVDQLGPAHWHAPLNLHIALRSTGDVEESRPWLDRARESAARLSDPGSPLFLENATGQLFMADGDAAEAVTRFQEALRHAPTGFASITIRLNLAEALLALGRDLDATEEAREAEREAILRNVVLKLPEVYRTLGRIMAHDLNIEAFVLFERSLELASARRGLPLEEAHTLQAYAMAEHAVGHTETARDLFARALELYRDLGAPGVRRSWVDCYDAPPPPFASDLKRTEE